MFVLVVTLLTNPSWIVSQPTMFIRILFFCYNGFPGFTGVGATWFISTIVQLYVLSPLFYFLISKLKVNKNFLIGFLLFIFILIFGLLERLLFKHFELDWNVFVYTFSLCNIDLFFGGFILNSITRNIELQISKKILVALKIFSVVILMSFVFYNSYIYTIGKEFDIFLYQYIFPSIYLCIVAFYIILFDTESFKKRNIQSYSNNIIDFISHISFELYLIHSNIGKAFEIIFDSVSKFNFGFYLLYLFSILTTTIIIGYFFHLLSERIILKLTFNKCYYR